MTCLPACLGKKRKGKEEEAEKGRGKNSFWLAVCPMSLFAFFSFSIQIILPTLFFFLAPYNKQGCHFLSFLSHNPVFCMLRTTHHLPHTPYLPYLLLPLLLLLPINITPYSVCSSSPLPLFFFPSPLSSPHRACSLTFFGSMIPDLKDPSPPLPHSAHTPPALPSP